MEVNRLVTKASEILAKIGTKKLAIITDEGTWEFNVDE